MCVCVCVCVCVCLCVCVCDRERERERDTFPAHSPPCRMDSLQDLQLMKLRKAFLEVDKNL